MLLHGETAREGDEVEPRKLTVREYTQAFFTWAVVSELPEKLVKILKQGMMHLLSTFQDQEFREPQSYCDVLDAWASDVVKTHKGDTTWVSGFNDFGELRLRIRKSCLLDRLIYCGEYVRVVPCPEHNGDWSGLRCSTGCGCLTGWLPAKQ
jgi:hypothetical protein